jgi:hypothetical protein
MSLVHLVTLAFSPGGGSVIMGGPADNVGNSYPDQQYDRASPFLNHACITLHGHCHYQKNS